MSIRACFRLVRSGQLLAVFALLFAASPLLYAQPARDLVSDAVGATAGVFAVDESGQATYSIAIAVPPGTAGVAPTLSLDYSSQAGVGVMGKGWSIGGQSLIERCRKTREAGDFYWLGAPWDGNSLPVGLSHEDAFCLDGQRLLLVSGTYGANGAIYAPELEPWTRVTSRNGNNSANPGLYTGPQSFTVERKDGSISEYGNSTDSRIERNPCGGGTGMACAIVAWALNRTEDSTGNYLTWHYRKFLNGTEVTGSTASDEQVLSEVRYTGKRVLPGQAGTASSPYARVLFDHGPDPLFQQRSWQAGSYLARSRRLNAIKVQDPYTGTPRTVRYYGLNYVVSGSNSGLPHLASVQECNKGPGDTGVDSSQVCYPATTFTQAGATYQFNQQAAINDNTINASTRTGVRFGDVDGDGRLDMVWARNTGETYCKARIYVSYGDRVVEVGVSKLTLATPPQQSICLPYEFLNDDERWQLIDYDGDGRDDLMLSGDVATGSYWRIHSAAPTRPSSAVESPFLTQTNLLGSINFGTATYVRQIDFNGDGLPDVLYPGSSEDEPPVQQTHVRLRERYEVSPGTWALRFGPAQAASIEFSASDPCSPQFAGTPKPYRCGYLLDAYSRHDFQAAEFDGDGRGDLMLKVYRYYDSTQTVDVPEIRLISLEELEDWQQEVARSPQALHFEGYWYFFVSRRSSGGSLALESYDSLRMREEGTGEMPGDLRHIQLADFNGDGLTDLLYRLPSVSNGQTWRLRLNTGKGFSSAPVDATGIVNPDLVQVADVNGDGRADLLYPPTGTTCGTGDTPNSNRPFCVRYGQHSGLATPRHVPGSGAHATSNPFDHDHFFADFDGDGAVDYVRFKRSGSTLALFTSRSSSRHQARDVIVGITDGIGATTQITYQPLTNAGVYRRDTGALTAASPNGRGSPTFDLLAPMYVVAKVGSSAPTYADPAALSEVGYRYTGAKLQSGGRGFLGFREIASFDGVHTTVPARHVVSQTRYRQDFPFIGNPQSSEKRVIASALSYGSAGIDACRGDPEALGQSCFYSVGLTWPSLTGIKISGSVSIWACQGTGNGTSCPIADNPIREACIDLGSTSPIGEFNPLGTQQPIFPYLTASSEESNAYNSTASGNGSWLGTTESVFCHEDTFGNLTYSRIHRWDGTSGTGKLLSAQITENSYTNDAVAWRLGRLTETDVQTSGDCVDSGGGMACTNWESRKSVFAYDMASSAKTGLLNQEKVQPGGAANEELRTLRSLDAYGNPTHAYQCSRYEADGSTLTDAECRSAARVSHRPPGTSGEITAVHRYTRTAYDSRGRYPTATYLPYYNGGNGPNGTVTELAATTINARDEFGNIIQQTDINGTIATARYGALGRPYYAGDNTGQAATTTYRWCSQVSCPLDAAYRSRTVAATSGANQAAPTTWNYHDRLGRPILSVVEGFDAGQFSATCSYYDTKTRPERGSEPFFLSTAAVGGEPNFQNGAYDPCNGVAWTRTEYDVLGRPTRTTLPDSNTLSVAYSGLVTTTTNAKGQVAREVRNALGQVIERRQANPGSPGSLGLSLSMTYDAHGNLLTLTRNAGRGDIVTRHEYDGLGRRTQVHDPDRGTERAFYNAAGEVIRTVDAADMEVRLDIDALGRTWRRQSGQTRASSAPPPPGRLFADGFEALDLGAAGLTSDLWVYDTAANGKGLLHYEERSTQGEASYRRTLSYDNRGRPSSQATLLDGQTYTEAWAYDALGRLWQTTDASGSTVEQRWNPRGHARSLRNADTPSEVYQQINALNARGQVTEELRGAATLERDFHPLRGWLTDIRASTGTTIQNLSYEHDALGNLTQRKDIRANQTEDFAYDGLNRLETATVKVGAAPAVTVLNLSYDTLGNLCNKNGQAYSYDGRDGCNASGTSASASPHAVTRIGNATYRYGARGELEYSQDGVNSQNDRWLAYDGLQNLSLVLVGSLMAPSAELNLRYGPGGERYRREERIGASTTVTRSIGSVEFITRPNGVTETKRHIAGVLIETRFSHGAATTKRYVYPDGLGSVDVLVNQGGTVQERLSFDGHGSRRSNDDWRTIIHTYTPANTTRGFTGHEHLDPFKLIHMNGRVYDPQMGRFIQADPLLDQGIQGLNRYTYALNNPLTFTDPSGYSSWNRWLRTVAAIAVTIYSGGSAAGASWGLFGSSVTAGQAFAITVAGGFTAGALQSGNLKGGLYGAFGSAAFYGVGTAFTQANAGWAYTGSQLNRIGAVAKTVSHGLVGGIMTDLQGGKFGHGFISAGATQAVSPQIDLIDARTAGFSAQRTLAAAALGGSVSAITGGKFANGAVTAAFSRAFNDEVHPRGRQNQGDWMTDEQWEETSALRERAESIVYRASGEDGIVDITYNEFLEVYEHARVVIGMRSDYVGGYQNMEFDSFLWDVRNQGDTMFFGDAGGTRFRISGTLFGTVGPYVGGDINYVGIGISFAQGQRSLQSAHMVVRTWNSSGAGTYSHIPQRLNFTTAGYLLWNKK